jgi:hypothetical protein
MRDRHSRFLRALLGAIGAGAALGATGCGGKVVFDGLPGGGTGGSASQSSSTGSVCTPMPTMNETVQHVCAMDFAQPCPGPTDPTLFNVLSQQLNTDFCSTTLDKIACGPDPTMQECCYDVLTSNMVCEGRPLLIAGEARTASIAKRDDWRAGEAPAIADLDATTRAALAQAWAHDARFEHASIASFARFTLDLLAVGAPADLVAAAQRAMGDEIVHAALGFGLAAAYAGEPMGPSALDVDGAAQRMTLVDVTVATAREGCIGETIAALVVAEALEGATDPAVRAALSRIAADEAEHAALAWRTVAWAIATGGAAVRDAVARVFAAPNLALDDAPIDASISTATLRAHGRLSADARRTIAARALRDVIAPSARALLYEDAASSLE